MKSELEEFMAYGVLNILQHIFRTGKLAPDLPAGEGHGSRWRSSGVWEKKEPDKWAQKCSGLCIMTVSLTFKIKLEMDGKISANISLKGWLFKKETQLLSLLNKTERDLELEIAEFRVSPPSRPQIYQT